MEGWLHKKSSNFLKDGWSKRYFKTEGVILKYFLLELDNEPRDVIYLKTISHVEHTQDASITNLFTIFTGDNKSLVLRSDSEDECNAWVTCLSVFNYNPLTIEIPKPIFIGLASCFNVLDESATSTPQVFNYHDNLTVKQLYMSVLKSNNNFSKKDIIVVGEVTKLLLRSLPECVLTNKLITPIIAECTRLTRTAIMEPEKELNELVRLLSLIREPYFSFSLRLFNIIVSVANTKLCNMTPKQIALKLSPNMVDTFLPSPQPVYDLAPFFIILATFHNVLFPLVKLKKLTVTPEEEDQDVVIKSNLPTAIRLPSMCSPLLGPTSNSTPKNSDPLTNRSLKSHRRSQSHTFGIETPKIARHTSIKTTDTIEPTSLLTSSIRKASLSVHTPNPVRKSPNSLASPTNRRESCRSNSMISFDLDQPTQIALDSDVLHRRSYTLHDEPAHIKHNSEVERTSGKTCTIM